MEAYTDFAGVYDTFMDETPYEEWCEFLDAALTRYRIKEETADTMLLQEQNSVVDLGCGTGTLTELLAAKGYDMIGIDNSQEMLQIAMEKRARSGLDILYLQQDMREFELYGAVGAVISVCDSLNYLLTEEELLSTFLLVHNYLYPGGVFIFDFNTVYKYAEVIGDATIAENREECSFIWENTYDDETELNEYALTLFVRGEDGRYERFEEFHYQKAYAIETVEKAAAEAGMEFIAVYDAFTREEPSDTGERVYVILKERGKSGIRKQ